MVENCSTSMLGNGRAEDQISETKGNSLLGDRQFLSLVSSLTACVRPTCDLEELRRAIQTRQNTARLHMAAAVPGGQTSTSQRRRSSQLTGRADLRHKNRNFTDRMLGKPAVIVE